MSKLNSTLGHHTRLIFLEHSVLHDPVATNRFMQLARPVQPINYEIGRTQLQPISLRIWHDSVATNQFS